MRLLLLDPGLSHRSGHNAAMLEEFAQHAAATPGWSLACACSATLDPAAFEDIACVLQPVFRVNGYSGFLSDTDSHAALLHDLLTTCAEDLALLDWASFDFVLMPTAYPVHLAAVAHWLGGAPALRLAAGLLMPPRFWSGNARAAHWLEALMQDTLATLAQRPNTVLYSEVAHDAAGTAFAAPMLLPPWSDASSAWVGARVAIAPPHTQGAVRFGFFGAPTVRKGAQHLANVLATGLPADTSISIALPAGHEAMAARWHDPARRIDARTLPHGNRHYLAAMSEVDAVVAFYDPIAYAGQMSGIVAEAAALGKPLLVAQGCDAVSVFLQTHAPGSAVALPYGDAGLWQGLALSPGVWQGLTLAARAAAPGVQRLKRMDHYLRGIGATSGR